MNARKCLLVGLVALGLCTGFSHFSHFSASRSPSGFAAQPAMRDHSASPGSFHDGHFHHHFRRGAIFIFAAPLAVWPPPDGVPPGPVEYIEQGQPGVAYYCPGVGYYPQVSDCPAGWLRVEPAESQPQ